MFQWSSSDDSRQQKDDWAAQEETGSLVRFQNSNFSFASSFLFRDELSGIGEIFEGMMKELRVYKAYAMSFSAVNDQLAQLFSSTEGKMFLNKPHFSRLGRLDALLIAPVQRLPRFELLLKVRNNSFFRILQNTFFFNEVFTFNWL